MQCLGHMKKSGSFLKNKLEIGDVVKLKGTYASKKIGLLVAKDDFNLGWHTVMCDNEEVHWPESQIEAINESW